MSATTVNLRMHTKAEKAKLEAQLTPDLSKSLELKDAHIVEDMTARHRVGIILTFEDEAGKKYHAQVSAQVLMNGIASAARGFCYRVGDDPDKA